MDQLPAIPKGDPVPDLRELVPIGPDEQEQLVKRLKNQHDNFKSAVQPLHDALDRWHSLYEATKRTAKTFPWPNASNYTVPAIMSTIDSLHSRVVKAIFEVDPLWLTRPRTIEGVEMAEKAQWYLDYWADQMDLPQELDLIIQGAFIAGTGVAKVDWAEVKRQIPNQPSPVEQQFGMEGPQAVTEYRGPKVTNVPLKDFILIPADAPSIEEAVYVGHRVWRTREDLEDRMMSGFYFNVERLFEASEGDNLSDKFEHPSGLVTASEGNTEYEETRQYEIVELYGRYDFGDGIAVPALMAFSPQHEILLRLEPYPYEYGRPPYVDFTPLPRANYFWGRSIAEVLESAQAELTALHNARTDTITRKVKPPIKKRFGSQWDETEQPLEPGAVIEVTDMDEVQEMQLQDVPHSLFAHANDLYANIERVTGMSDVFMGRNPGQYTTATAVNRVTSEGLARVDVMVSRVQQSMKKLGWMIWWLLYQYRPFYDFFFMNNQEFSINKSEMRPQENGLMPFELIPHGQLSDASKEAQRQQALMLMQVISPMIAQYYPDGIRHLALNVLKKFDVKDAEMIVGPSWNALQQMMQQAMAQAAAEGAKTGGGG